MVRFPFFTVKLSRQWNVPIKYINITVTVALFHLKVHHQILTFDTFNYATFLFKRSVSCKMLRWSFMRLN